MKKHNNSFSFVWIVLFVIVFAIPFIMSVKSVIFGQIPFWYDPARDLLLAWDNLKKPTLIGPPAGIPGIFYGPYWIWLLSVGLAISKDPRMVVFLALTLPYFLLLPIMLLNLKKLLDKSTVTVMWLLFILSYIGYTNQIWNPYLAPLIFFVIVFIISKMDFDRFDRKQTGYMILLGIAQGLLINFHISFGIGIFAATILFMICQISLKILKTKNRLHFFLKWFVSVIGYVSSIVFVFLPTLLFEYRHGFNQIKSLLFTLSQSFFYHSSVVGQVGLSKIQIITSFTEKPSELLHIPHQFGLVISLSILILTIYYLVKYKKTEKREINVQIFLITCIVGILAVYLTSKNPVWGYHFIGVEVIFLFLIAFLVKRISMLKIILIGWVCILLLTRTYDFALSFLKSSATATGLSATKKNVKSIFKDAKNTPFSYSAKNAAIYTFDYDYLFRWIGQSEYSFIPKNEISDSSTAYLIIPPELIGDKIGFVENRTPSNTYMTVKEWTGEDNVLIIKRIRNN